MNKITLTLNPASLAYLQTLIPNLDLTNPTPDTGKAISKELDLALEEVKHLRQGMKEILAKYKKESVDRKIEEIKDRESSATTISPLPKTELHSLKEIHSKLDNLITDLRE
jgi:septation ring formation regulator EzrA